MKSIFKLIITAVILTLITFIDCGCRKPSADFNAAVYTKEIEQWQEKRAKSISSENGWLTLAGLFWLHEGENKFGSDSSNQIVLPQGKAPSYAGSIWLENGHLGLRALPGADVTCNDSAVTSAELRTDMDTSGKPTIIRINTLSFYVIKRGEQLGVRVKNKENPARVNFKGLDFYPINPKWRIEATFEPFIPPKVMPISSVIGTVENDTFPGAVVFQKDGKECRLIASYERGSDMPLYIMFSDETSGKETYGNGRQLSAPMPDSTGKVLLDFNIAYNWPCAYTDFATCPIPPRENHLPFRVEAGEKKYLGHEH